MRDQEVFALLRVDVDTAGDDHERRSIGQVEVAVVVDVADIADRRHGPVGRAGLGGLDRVVEVGEFAHGREPQRSGLTFCSRLHVLVEHMHLARHHLTDSSPMAEPLLAVAHRETEEFGSAVVLEQDRPPPVDHLLLDLHRARRRGVDRDLKRRHVVFLAHRLGKLEHAPEHRRHQLAVGRPVFVDKLQIVLRVESLHDDGGAPHPDREGHRGDRSRVIKRRRRKVGHAFAVTPQLGDEVEDRQVLGWRLLGSCRRMPLGRPVVPEE